jgi:PKD repeat protein
MVMHSKMSDRKWRLGIAMAACAVLAVASGCTVSNQEAPDFVGPSGAGLSMTLKAQPEILPRDGVSMSTISVEARAADANGVVKPLANAILVLGASAGTVSAEQITTDTNGRASFVYTAPGANQDVSQVTIFVTPLQGGDIANAHSESIRLAVVGPSVPFATFNFNPASPQGSEVVTFDASFSRLDNQPCPLCTYSWTFGDGSSGTGMVIQHSYTSFGVQNVTLTVTSPQGTSGTLTRAVVVALPAAPTADFTFSPSSPAALQAVTFRSISTVGLGAQIVRYVWNFDDGNPPVDAGNSSTYNYATGFAGTSSHSITLTVTDSLGRTATSPPHMITIP